MTLEPEDMLLLEALQTACTCTEHTEHTTCTCTEHSACTYTVKKLSEKLLESHPSQPTSGLDYDKTSALKHRKVSCLFAFQT